MISTSGRASLITRPGRAQRPPPPTGPTTFAGSGTSSSSSSPSEPWPATIAGSSNGGMNASPPSAARALAYPTRASTLPPPMCTIAPCARVASTLAIGASSGTNTSHGIPRAAAAVATAWAWLPADAATTPFAQPSCPSTASLLATPRTLNEPVRWRFSAFSTTVPPARSENVRVDRIGVRRATASTAARAARTSSAESDDCIHLDLSPERQRRHADGGARRRLGLEVGGVRLVDVIERRDVGHVDADADGVLQLPAGRRGDDRQVVEHPPRLV